MKCLIYLRVVVLPFVLLAAAAPARGGQAVTPAPQVCAQTVIRPTYDETATPYWKARVDTSAAVATGILRSDAFATQCLAKTFK
jgi:hypothetical protein